MQPLQVKAFAKLHLKRAKTDRIAEADIKRLSKRGENERKRLRAALRQYDDLAARFDLVQGVPRIGERKALCTVIRLPELG